MRKKGFVLIEILVAIMILAALAIIAFTSFDKTKYRNDKERAIVYLRAIRTAQQIYWASWKKYACDTTCSGVAAVNAALGVEIQLPGFSDPDWSVSSSTPTTFTASAKSNAASGGKTITLDQDGTWGGTYTPLPLSA